MSENELVKKILEIECEQKERETCALYAYNRDTVHRKQLEFHKCIKKNRWVFGGNRSGKTECGAVEAVWMVTATHPYRENRDNVSGWVVSLSEQVQRDVAQAKVLKYLPKRLIADIVMLSGRKDSPEYGVIDYIVVKNVLGGLSRIGFKSCDQGREKFQGASLDFVWFDEEPPREIYDECVMRVFDKGGNIFGTMTPLKGLTWVYDVVEMNGAQNPEVWCEHMEWKDNPYLDPKEVDAMLKITSEEQQISRRFGKFYSGEGLVYPEFNPDVHVIEPFDVPRGWQAGISIDPGLHNPTSCHFYAVDFDGNIYVVGEHYERGRDIDYHAAKIFELADKLGWEKDGKGRLNAIIDSAAGQITQNASKSVADLFFEKGIMVNTHINKHLYAGIQRIKSLLCQDPPRLFIFKQCVNMIREMKSYWWGQDDSPRKTDDHAMDDLRYFVMSGPQTAALPAPYKSEVSKDKDALARLLKRRMEWTNEY